MIIVIVNVSEAVVLNFLNKTYQEGIQVFRGGVIQQQGAGKALSWKTLGLAGREEKKIITEMRAILPRT